MNEDLRQQLALSLNVPPWQVMEASPANIGPGYTVLLVSYQKFQNVLPAEAPLQNGLAHAPNSNRPIPKTLQHAFARPDRASMLQLRQLCDALGLDYTKDLRKTQLLQLVRAWKKEHRVDGP